MARCRLIYILTVAGIFTFYVFYIGTSAWYLLCAALLLPAISLAAAVIFGRGTDIDARFPRYFTCDEKEDFFYRITPGKSGLPVRGRFTASMNGKDIVMEFVSGEELERELEAAFCGVINIKIHKAYLLDYLGLFRIPLGIEKEYNVPILPKPVPCELPDIPLSPESDLGQNIPRMGTKNRSSVYELREYRPGDMIRDIHWKASAKTDTVVIREFLPESDISIALTVDVMPLSKEKKTALGRLLWISKRLSEEGRPHAVMWIEPRTHELMCLSIPRDCDIIDFLCMFVGKEPDGTSAHISEIKLDTARFDICAEKTEEGAADK